MRSPLEPTVQPQATNAGSSEAVNRRFSDANATGRMNTAVQKNLNNIEQSVASLTNQSERTGGKESAVTDSNSTTAPETTSTQTTPPAGTPAGAAPVAASTPGGKESAVRNPLLGLTPDEQKLLQSKYGYAYALIVGNTSLAELFFQAITGSYEIEKFTAELEGTEWFKTYDKNKRAYQVLKATGGADWESQRKFTADAIQKSATEVLGKALTAEELDASIDEFLQGFGVDKVNVPKVVGNFVGKKFSPNGALTYGGSAATNGVALNTYAKSMGFKISGSELSNYVSKIAAGEDTIDNIQSNVRKNAINLYPQYADRFNSGATFDDVMYPYIKTMEQLGFDVSNLDTQKNGTSDIFVDDLLQKAAFAVDAKGNPAPMSVYNFRSAALKDKRWQYTDNAYEKYAGIAKDVISSMGGSV